MTDAPFHLVHTGGVARLTLCRPTKRNALGARFWSEFPEAVRGLSASGETRVLIIDSQGPHFTAGIDLALFAEMAGTTNNAIGREGFVHTLAQMQAGFDALEAARFPIIAAIQGGCIGGGVDLISACDIRLATRDAYFCIEEINVGMMADLGTLQRLPTLLPAGVVRELAFAGTKLMAERAYSLGLVNTLADDYEALLVLADEMAARIAQKPPLAIAASKDCLNHARDHGVAQSMRYMRAVQSGIFNPDDVLEAVSARAEGRVPNFDNLSENSKPVSKN